MDHPNIIKMTTHFHTAANNKIFSHIVMEYMDTSLFSILKKQRELKRPIDLLRRKLITFQLFKGLYYLSVNKLLFRSIISATEIWNPPTYFWIGKIMNLKFAISALPKSYKKSKTMCPTSAPGTIALQNSYLIQLNTALRWICGPLDVSWSNC